MVNNMITYQETLVFDCSMTGYTFGDREMCRDRANRDSLLGNASRGNVYHVWVAIETLAYNSLTTAYTCIKQREKERKRQSEPKLG